MALPKQPRPAGRGRAIVQLAGDQRRVRAPPCSRSPRAFRNAGHLRCNARTRPAFSTEHDGDVKCPASSGLGERGIRVTATYENPTTPKLKSQAGQEPEGR